ncbi:MAG: hypothetical protein A3F11_07135 [Gammaproteobacteria bacterium RIFCSPHIGHO2_12_FULL_37_14]|nr:MAG: hypothetical protein A3F11_07135 [Gammaproteobacteria bacterium RIFCSPHIGHO2_12_FULL_37_14]
MSTYGGVTNIIAYLGAAAWIPQIITWVCNFFSKPVIAIIPEKIACIGYTIYGPIFNLRLSINTKKKDSIIDFMSVELCHENGSKHNFEWAGMAEFFSEVKNNKGENQIIQRDIIPIAIKLNTLSLVERFFRFQDSAFIKKIRVQSEKFVEMMQYMKKKNENYPADFIASKDFEDHMKFMRENFYWQPGSYTVKFRIRSPEKIKINEKTYNFELTQENIDALRSNLEEVGTFIQAVCKSQPADQNTQPNNFRWVNTVLESV